MNVLESSILFFFFLGLIIVLLAIKKFYYKYHLKKKFNIIPRANIKGIASIGMTVALSIAILILLTIISADIASIIFRTWPGTRIIFESILIKIGGLLFGPIIGICIGGATDFLTISLTTGVFHIGYFLSAMFFGLVGGMIKNIVSLSNKNEFKFCLYSTILFIISLLASFVMLYYFAGDQNWLKLFTFNFLGIDIDIRLYGLIFLVAASLIISNIFIWILYIYKKRYYKFIKRGKLIEESHDGNYNNLELFKINNFRIKKIYKNVLDKKTINVLSLVASTNSISSNEINHYFRSNNNHEISQLITKNYIEFKNNRYQLTKQFIKSLIANDYISHYEKVSIRKYERTKKYKMLAPGNMWFMSFISVFVCIVISELMVNVLMIPAYDAIVSTLPYETWLLIRILLFIPMIIINLVVIFPIFKIITPNVNLSITDDIEVKKSN